MKKAIGMRLLIILLLMNSSAFAADKAIIIDAAKPGARIPSSLYGIFFEEISHAGEGGLYGELIQNRGFEDANLPPACKLENGFLIPPRTPHFWNTPTVSDWKKLSVPGRFTIARRPKIVPLPMTSVPASAATLLSDFTA